MTIAARSFLAMAALLALVGAGSASHPAQAPTAIFSDVLYEGTPTSKAPPSGHYRNPVIAGSAADPAITRVGKDYYLATSSMTHWPGVPIFRSRDLVHWTQVGAAVSRPEQMRIEGLDTWQGLYAPDLKFHDGRFYLTGTCYGCGGNFIMTATQAEGPWSPPVWLPFDGIDPSIFFDHDGRAYVVNNGLPPGGPQWDGHRAIWLQEIDIQTLKLKGERTMIVDGGVDRSSRPFWIEGPHLIRRDGHYVLICAEGGTKEHHRDVAFRADALRGPYLARREPILTQDGLPDGRPDPVVQAGHADLVETPDGDWWAVFLASRPFGPDQLDYATGRETYLLPVAWRDGWPEILPPGQVVPATLPRPRLPMGKGTAPSTAGGRYAPQWRLDRLDWRWIMLGSPARPWWSAGAGQLRLTATTPTLGGRDQPALLALKQSDVRASFSATVALSGGRDSGAAGLTAFAGSSYYWALLVANLADGQREVRLVRRIGQKEPEEGRIVAHAPLAAGGKLRLRIAIDGPDMAFEYALGDAGWRLLGGPQDGRTLAVSRTGGFVGTILGMTALD